MGKYINKKSKEILLLALLDSASALWVATEPNNVWAYIGFGINIINTMLYCIY